MSFVPDFDKLLYGFLVLAGSMGMIKWIKVIDDEVRACSEERIKWLTIGIGMGNSLMVFVVLNMVEMSIPECAGILLLGIYLSVCTIMDVLLCQVSDLLQYIGLLGGIMWVCVRDIEASLGVSLLIFVLLQYILFMRMYGKADGMAFCICALYWLGLGYDMEMYLYHMGFSMVLLAIVQAFRGNISKKGNLKKPIAMYPYISAAFWNLFLQII